MDRLTLQGFIVGFITAGVLGLALQYLLLHMAKVHAFGKKQGVYLETKQSPLQVLWNSIKGLFLFTLAMGILYTLYQFATPRFPADIAQTMRILIGLLMVYAAIKLLVPSLTASVPFVLRLAVIALVLYIIYQIAAPYIFPGQ